MKHQTAASTIPQLQEALGKILQSASIIAQVSTREFATYSELRTPARLGIYQILRAIYAEHPDLDPLVDVRSSVESGHADEAADPGARALEADGQLDPESARRARTILAEAYELVSRGDEAIATGTQIEATERARFRALCAEALEAIQAALQQQPHPPKDAQK